MLTKFVAALEAQPGFEQEALLEESNTEAYAGHLGRARGLSRQAEDMARREGDKTKAADIESSAILLEAQFGDSAGARRLAAASEKLGSRAAMAMALAGNTVAATKSTDGLTSLATPCEPWNCLCP
jgi:hypothetical protein